MYDRAKYIEPSDKKSWQEIENPIATIKYDGGSYFASVDSTGKLSFISRRPSVKGGFPNRTTSVPHLTDKLIPEFAGTILNGEIIHSGFSKTNVEHHSVASGILNSLPPKAIETQARNGPLRYVIHDVLSPIFKTYQDKLDHMTKVEKALNKSDLIFVPQVHRGKEAIQALIQRTKERGQEGVVVLSSSLDEAVNPRFKIKHKITHNLLVSKIIQLENKEGKPQPFMGSLELKDATGRVVGYVGTGFSRNDREDAWLNPDRWVNHGVQVTSLGFARNALRMPVYNGFSDGDIDRVV